MRAASAVRNTPARKMQVVTARQPPTSDVGLTQDPIGSPYPPAGIRPDAIAPATVPRKNGVITDEAAKIAPKTAPGAKVSADLRNAKLAPRQHDPRQSQHKRDEQRGHRGGEGGRKSGPPYHQHVDQPHMVGFPHRSDAVVDQCPHFRTAHTAASGQIIETRTEVGPSE